MDGILLIDKPIGWTSFDVVAKVRRILRQSNSRIVASSDGPGLSDHKTGGHKTSVPKVKVGHTGTLDPQATGLLILVIGSYCKRAGEFSKMDKTYEVTMKLGQTSTTGDEEGEKVIVSGRKPELNEVDAALKTFTGNIDQVPPAYSAIKVNGQRAYKLARAGQEVKLEARPVTIYNNEMISYEYPLVKFTSHVSSGTYIRSLVEDIGNNLSTGAYMTALRRISVGGWKIDQAITMTDISMDVITKNLITL